MGQLHYGKLAYRKRELESDKEVERLPHPNSWTLSGTIRIAFTAIGNTFCHHNRETSHSLTAMSCVAGCAMQAQGHQLARLLEDAVAKRSSWLIVQRRWDETPHHVTFGMLQELLAPSARYLMQLAKGQRIRLTYEEVKGIDTVNTCRNGVLELMAQVCSVHWGELRPSGETIKHDVPVVVPPVFLENAKASTIYQALADTMPALQFANLANMAKVVRHIVLLMHGDVASANLRLQAATLKQIMEWNEAADSEARRAAIQGRPVRLPGRILAIMDNCSVHTLNNMELAEFDKVHCTPKLHAIAYICGDPKFLRALGKAVAKLIAQELDFQSSSHPLKSNLDHARKLCNMTIGRLANTRGRNDGEAKGAQKIEKITGDLLGVVIP